MKFSRMNKRKRKPINIPKHKGQNLSFAQKHEICKRYAKKPRPSQIDLANEYCASQSSISEILSNREKWISIDESEVHKKKNRQAKQKKRWSDEAWSSVTEITIRNCWTKTGILPDNSLTTDYDTDALDIDSTVQQYIDMLETNKPLLAAESITIDNELPIEHLDDDKILTTVRR